MDTLNIHSRSLDWRGARLSNFSADAFVLDGVPVASVEGFIQGTKFPEGHPNRPAAFQATGIKAKRFGKEAGRAYVWWQHQIISYGTHEHYILIERAIQAKFDQNFEAMKALLATDDLILTHDTGDPDPANSSLPASVFCEILTRIRAKALIQLRI